MTFEAKRLGDVAEIIGGGTPSTKDAGNWDGDIPWLTPKDLSTFEGIYIDRGSRSITEQGFKTSSAKMLPTGAVLYTSRAPIGYVAIASNPISTNQGFKSLILKDGYVPEFVFYLLKASKSEIEAHASGGTFAEISAKALSDVVLRFPPKIQQQAISKLLKSLDEKIAANNAISKTLEDIAQTIFKSWFIDFDPVKAKMAGEKPAGMDAATAALFPDSVEESQLGLIPKGWSISKVNSLTKTLVGGTPSRAREEFWNGDIPWFNSGKVNEFRIIEASEYITQLGLQKSAAKLLPVGTTVLAITGATLGQYSRVEISASGTQNVIGILESEAISNEFIYSFIAFGISRIVAAGTGGAQQHINKDIVDNFEFLFPGKKLVDVFTSTVRSMFQEISSLTFSSKNLSQLRDALLPRLISGKLQIPEEILAS